MVVEYVLMQYVKCPSHENKFCTIFAYAPASIIPVWSMEVLSFGLTYVMLVVSNDGFRILHISYTILLFPQTNKKGV